MNLRIKTYCTLKIRILADKSYMEYYRFTLAIKQSKVERKLIFGG